MNTKLAAAMFAAAALLAVAGASQAAIIVDHTVANQLYGLDSGVMLKDFDAISSANVSYSGNVVTAESPVVNSASPPYTGPGSISICCQSGSNYDADPTRYASVQGSQTGTFSVLNGRYLTAFSFYMGSPDTYNHVTFNLVGGGSQTLDGDAIWGGSPPGNGDRTKGFRVYYNFNGAKVSSINFSSGQNAFEFDGLAGAVPEPTTWALMIGGFGFAGGMLRAKRRAAVAA